MQSEKLTSDQPSLYIKIGITTEVILSVCKVPLCNKKSVANGYCSMHYARVRRNGDPNCVRIEHHGMEKSSEYKSWQGMKERCYKKNNHKYYRYGGRGIIVCPQWKHSFKTFISDMGVKPFPKAQIDRIDNDGNYEPSNCRWATPLQNIRNASCTKLTIKQAKEIRQIYKTSNLFQREIGDLYGVSQTTIYSIVNNKTWT